MQRPAMLRYAQWIVRARWLVIAASIAIATGAGALAATLPLHSDFSYLLPPSAKSVQHLRAIEKRARVIGTVMLAVESKDPARRQEAARKLRDRVVALGPELVSSVTFDESVARRFAWANRWLFVPLPELEQARDALRAQIDRAKLAANPLYVDLDDDASAAPAPGAATDGAKELRAKLADAEAKSKDPGELVSKDGHLQMMIIRTAFSSADNDKDTVLFGALKKIVADVKVEVPGVDIGIAGDVVVSLAEHDTILNGMVLAAVVTVVLVLTAMLLFFRSFLAVGALSWSLMVGTLVTFAITRLTIGELNIATAFLASIVVGNGINFGIIVLARYLEEYRAGRHGVEAAAAALHGTLRGTLTAAMTASVAYASLIITDFHGFRHFGIIGGIGMILCWVSAFTVLPAGIAIVDVAGRLKPRGQPRLGKLLARLQPRRFRVAAAVMLILVVAAGVETWRFLWHDPFEADFKQLRSESPAIDEERRWMNKVDVGFGQGISGGFVIAVPRREDVAPLLARLRKIDEGKDEHHRLFSRLNTLDDMMPDHQPEKLAVLRELRSMLTPAALDEMSPQDRADAEKLMPPADLRPLGDADAPEELAWPFIEADGSRGKVILAMSGWGYEIWNANDLVRFSDDVRALKLDPQVLLGGTAFVFADVIRSIERDGPRATLTSILGAILVVALIMGVGRHAGVTLICCLAGTLFMLAAASLLGLRVNFLDFVALPITIGIGIDYSVNIAARERELGPGRSREAVETVGAAVALCSFTTIVGYGSLLLSKQRAIRSFGEAAILGEATCLGAALALAPALLYILGQRALRTRVD